METSEEHKEEPMEDKNIMDLEDVTLNTLIETGAETLLVEDQKGQRKLVYIHAVSTINMG